MHCWGEGMYYKYHSGGQLLISCLHESGALSSFSRVLTFLQRVSTILMMLPSLVLDFILVQDIIIVVINMHNRNITIKEKAHRRTKN